MLIAAHRIQQSGVCHGDTRHLQQTLTQDHRHLVHAEAARLAVHQTDVDAGVHLALRIAGIDGGQRVTHLGKFTDDAFDLACFGLSHFQ